MYLDRYIIDPTQYEEEDTIGKGNFSSVSLVHPKKKDNIKIALKKIPVDINEKDSQKYFIREILIMSEINHPCLIKFIGFSFPTNKDQTFKIYSEYLPNKTLIEQLKQEDESKQLTATQKTIIIYGIASAMSYLHKKKIVHRDLKPENVFLNSNFEPVISDFGLSKICTDDITMTSRLGTPYFMAPELFDEDNTVTNKIDVYAFAITLLSVFTTNYKFDGRQPRSINQLMNNILNGKRYKIPSNVPKFYQDLINRCWLNDPAKRPSFDEIVDLFESSDEFLLDGADKKKVKEFILKVKNPKNLDDLRKSNNKLSFISSESDDEIEDTQEFDFQ